VDYTELFGGEPATMREDLVEQWRTQLGRLDATQHVVTGVQTSPTKDGPSRPPPTSSVPMCGRRSPTAPIWTVGGWWEARLEPVPDGFRISSMTLDPTWQTGDIAVMTGTRHNLAIGRAPAEPGDHVNQARLLSARSDPSRLLFTR
jgi:hypothetical protein